MRANSDWARSYDALAVCTSGTLLMSSGAPGVSPRRASICAALASASFSCAPASVGEMRMSSAPCATGVPRSTGAAITRPGVSAATSACSSAISVPVARMKRAMGCSTASTGDTDTGGRSAAAASLVFASPALHADTSAAAASSRASPGFTNTRLITSS